MKPNCNKLWLCAPFIIVVIIDSAATINGNLATDSFGSNEIFPMFRNALDRGIWAYVAMLGIWIAVFTAIILFAPDILSEITSLSLVIGHAWGIMTWLIYDLDIRYELTISFFLFCGALFVLCDRRWRRILGNQGKAMKCGQQGHGA